MNEKVYPAGQRNAAGGRQGRAKVTFRADWLL